MGHSLLAEAAATMGQAGGSWNNGEVTGAPARRTKTPLREQKGRERSWISLFHIASRHPPADTSLQPNPGRKRVCEVSPV